MFEFYQTALHSQRRVSYFFMDRTIAKRPDMFIFKVLACNGLA